MSKPRQVYLLAGGRQSSREALLSLIKTVFEDNELPSPIIAYIGTANRDDESFFNRTAGNLLAAGAKAVNHALISTDHANLEKALNTLNSADIIFVSGGDVEEGIRSLREKGIINVLCKLYQQGRPFFGLSAGSIMLAKSWVRWKNPDDDSTAELFPCLGFVPIICDTHGEEDSWEELKAALNLSAEGEKGYGIVSGTAIRVHTDGKVDALGGATNQFIHRKGEVMRLSDILPAV